MRPRFVASRPTLPVRARGTRRWTLFPALGSRSPAAALALLDSPAAERPCSRRPLCRKPTRSSLRLHFARAAAQSARGAELWAVILSDAIEGVQRDREDPCGAGTPDCPQGGPFAPPVVLSRQRPRDGARPRGTGRTDTAFALSFARPWPARTISRSFGPTRTGRTARADAGAFADGGSIARMRRRQRTPHGAGRRSQP